MCYLFLRALFWVLLFPRDYFSFVYLHLMDAGACYSFYRNVYYISRIFRDRSGYKHEQRSWRLTDSLTVERGESRILFGRLYS